jgi:hypothetical protein
VMPVDMAVESAVITRTGTSGGLVVPASMVSPHVPRVFGHAPATAGLTPAPWTGKSRPRAMRGSRRGRRAVAPSQRSSTWAWIKAMSRGA